MSAEFLQHPSSASGIAPSTTSSNSQSMPENADWQLKLALQLSAETFEMEQKRREWSVVSTECQADGTSEETAIDSPKVDIKDLIDLEDPKMAARLRNIEEIKQLQRDLHTTTLQTPARSNFYYPSTAFETSRTTISGGSGIFGMSRISNTPVFHNAPGGAGRRTIAITGQNEGGINAGIASTPLSTSQVQWRSNAQRRVDSENVGATSLFAVPRTSGIGTAAVYWRKPNNLVIPYVKSSLFWDKRPSDDNLIQLVPTDSNVESLSTEELLKLFDPLLAKSSVVEAQAAGEAATSEEKSSSSVVSPKATTGNVTGRSKSVSSDVGKTKKEQPPLDKDKNSGSAVRSRSYQPPISVSAASLEDIQLMDRVSNAENQGKRLHDFISNEPSTERSAFIWHDVIVARRVRYPLPSVTDVMLITYTNLSAGPLKFTCAVGSSVDQILETVLFTCNVDLQRQHSKYALKVFGKEEYFVPDSALCDYAYVHNSIKMGKDIFIELGAAPVPKETNSNPYDANSAAACFSSIERKDLDVVLKTIKKELRRVQDNLRLGSSVRHMPAVQAVKVLCSLLHNVEPVDLVRAVNRFVAACESLSAAELDRSIEFLAAAIHSLLTAYCRSSNVSFVPEPINRRRSSAASESKEFVHVEDPFLFHIGSIHNLHQNWNEFAKFFVSAYVFHGVHEIMKKERSAMAVKEFGLYPYLRVDSWISFDNSRLCTLPRESRLCIVLYGVRVESLATEPSPSNSVKSIVEEQLAWASLPLFDSESRLVQETFFVPMAVDSTIRPWGPPPYVCDFNKHWPVLTVALPTFDQEIRFPNNVQLAPLRSSYVFDHLDVDTRSALEAIFENAANVKELARDEKDLLWEMRLYLIGKPEALPLVLASAFSWDCLFLSHIYQLLNVWVPLDTAQAIELLLPKFPDKEVRKYALDWIKKSGADELLGYLPQLVEALQFETYEDSALAQLLLQFARANRHFAFALFWLLEERTNPSFYGCRCRFLQKIMVRLLGESFSIEAGAQIRLMNCSDKVAMKLKSHREPTEREAVLRSNLELLDGYLLQEHVRLPLNPSVLAVGIDIGKSTFYNSKTVPMKIVYRCLNSYFEVLHKVGDDLRQDALVMQMIRLMNDIWLNEGFDLRIITFQCLSTGHCRGMIEVVPDSKTLREIHTEGGSLTGVLREDLTLRWLQKHNPSELDYEMALKNFRLSCAGWCVATYILGIGDRHNDNVLITSRGHVIHIDFGKYFGDAETFGGIKRDRTKFLLSNEMLYVINAGETKATTFFQEFVDNCCLAFNLLRKQCGLFVNLLKLMVCSGVPGLSMDAVEYISQNFCVGYSESRASEYFTRLVEETMASSFPKWNFLVHALAQQRKPVPSLSNDRLLSFVPTVYTEEMDGRIVSVDVVECQKWRIPEKVYMYKIRVQRERVRFPYFIFRSYKEFCEFYDLLSMRFPLFQLYGLSRSQNLGRTNIREVAERRKMEVAMFLKSLFMSSDEIVHSSLVYTFFHSILRDQETEDGTREGASRQGAGNANGLEKEIRGSIKVALEYRQEKLEVFISHVRDLATSIGGAAPDVYVKCYLRPGHSAESKRKTRVMPKSLNPTFNETLEYKLPLAYLVQKDLEVTVWRRDVLKENAFLGGVMIPLDNLNDAVGRKIDRWYRLENIRRARWW